MTAPVVDFHGHFLPRSAIAASAGAGTWYGATIHRSPDDIPVIGIGGRTHSMASDRYWDSWVERAARLAHVGIDVQVISLAPNLYRYELPGDEAVSLTREVNDEILEVVAAHSRFRGLAALPMQSSADAVRELERTMGAGLIGASVGTHIAGTDWDDPSLADLIAAAEDLGALLFIHPTQPRLQRAASTHHLGNVIGNPMETTIAAYTMMMGGVLDRHPGLRVLLSHAGGFVTSDLGRLEHAASVRPGLQRDGAPLRELARRFFYDCIAHDHGQLRALIGEVGIERIVLGTDYPADMGLVDPLSWLGAGDLTAEEVTAISAGNAAALLHPTGGPA